MPPDHKLYAELAAWWPLLSPPEDYEEEASFFAAQLLAAGDTPARTLLELGCGGGNNASYLKRSFEMTLIDRSREMLAVSQALNPECWHLEGDMRSVRLGRQFDRVFVRDAIVYMTTIDDLRMAMETAFGALPARRCRALRAWPRARNVQARDRSRWLRRQLPRSSLPGVDADPDPSDATYTVDYAYMLRESDGTVHV